RPVDLQRRWGVHDRVSLEWLWTPHHFSPPFNGRRGRRHARSALMTAAGDRYEEPGTGISREPPGGGADVDAHADGESSTIAKMNPTPEGAPLAAWAKRV